MQSSSNKSSKKSNKRLKVGRACYTCRAKKIKCDGLRPCMQCKARQRPCSFYKDGSLEQIEKSGEPASNDDPTQSKHQYLEPENDEALVLDPTNNAAVNTSNIPYLNEEQSPEDKDNEEDNDDRILFTDTTASNHSKLKRRGPLMESKVSHVFTSLGDNFRKMSATVDNIRLAEKLLDPSETYGNFITWMPEPSLPSRYSGSIEMPSRQVQFALIDHFFQERYPILCLFPRFHFYEQIESKGILITPLLLNAIYAHAARFVSLPDCPKPEIFYHRAKRLVDDFLDVPRVSTAIALYLLSLYEPSPSIYRPGAQHCRQWQYSGMACRMALELGLHDDSHIHPSLSATEIELRRRVFWCCYELDKQQSAGWERPWAISQTMVKTKDPSPLPEENDQDLAILDQLLVRIHLTYHFEETLILLSAFKKIECKKNADDIYCKFGMKKEEIFTKWMKNYKTYKKWLHSLKPDLQWTPTTAMTIKDIMELPTPTPLVANIHLKYNMMILDVLPHINDKELASTQSRIAAVCITQLVYGLLEHVSKINKFDSVAHSLMQAIKVHIRHLDDPDINVAQEAWLLFDRSIYCIQFLSNYAVIPKCNKFLQQVQSIYGTQDNQDKYNSTKASSSSSRKRAHSPPPPPPQPKLIPLTHPTGKGKGKQHEPVHFNPLPTYMANWSSQQQSNSNSNDVLQLDGENGRIYLDQQYRFEETSDNTNQLYTSMQTPYDQNQNQTQDDNNANVFHGDIMIPSQLLVDEPSTNNNTENYQSSSGSSNYMVSNNSNILWQERNDQNHNLEMTMDNESPGNKGLGVYMSSRQHYHDMIKKPPPPPQ